MILLPPTFNDWISLSGTVRPGRKWPLIANGATLKIDSKGDVVSETYHGSQFIASHDTSIRIRCDGRHLELDGNIGRLGRPDNVTGYSHHECFQRCLIFLDRIGIDPSHGQPYTRHELKQGRCSVTGFRFRHMDMTACFDAGSEDDAAAFIRRSGQVSLEGRNRLPVFDRGMIYWAKNSKYWGAKLYDKKSEIESNGGIYPDYAPHALLRIEAVLRQKFLVEKGWDNPDAWRDPRDQEAWWKKTFAPIFRAEIVMAECEGMSLRVQGAIAAWNRGENLRLSTSRASFYRLKREVKDAVGIDLDIPRLAANVVQFPTKTKTIVLRPVDLRPLANLPALGDFPGLTFKVA